MSAGFASHVVIFQQNWLSIHSTTKAVVFPDDTIRAHLLGPLAANFLDNFPNDSTSSSNARWPSLRLQLMISCETLMGNFEIGFQIILLSLLTKFAKKATNSTNKVTCFIFKLFP